MAGEGTKRSLGVAVLAGGASARMGTNKALLQAKPGGPTMIDIVVARLREAGLDPDILVTNSPEVFAFLDIPAVADDFPGSGSLGGIYTALNHVSQDRTLVVACDMPLLNPALLRHMASMPTEANALVPRWTGAGGISHLETMHAIYSRGCLEPARARIAAGKLKVQALLEDVRVQYINEAELRRYDPALESFRNVNTPEEWARLRGKL